MSLFAELDDARTRGVSLALATVVATSGSAPREPGARMLVYADGRTSDTVGGGKFEALVIEEALACLADGKARLREFTLREDEADSFGAICGGRVTVFIESLAPRERLFVFGGGHCGQALAQLAGQSGLHATLLDDRAATGATQLDGAALIGSRAWTARDAIVIVNRNPTLDRETLAAALRLPTPPGYVGMIGSRRKVELVFQELEAQGFQRAQLATVFAPIGLDIGSDAPMEIAVSILAEVWMVLRGRTGTHLRLTRKP